jgi:acyl carrier protein
MNTSNSAGDLRAIIIGAVIATAPDVADDIGTIGDDTDIFEEFELDSMDRMNIMTALVASTGVEIPDDRYPHLTSLGELMDHLS